MYSAYSDLSAEGYLGDNADTDLTSKFYVDNAIAGLKWKQSVKAASTASAILASDFTNGDTIDGIALVTGDRILIKDQSTGSENGIYIVTAGAPTRTTDADLGTELVAGAVFVEQGTVNADTAWVCNNDSITVNTTAITFTQFTGAAAYVWGDGLSNSGNTVNVGAGTGITVDATNVSLSSGYADGSSYDSRFVNIAGDTMTGTLNLPDNGLVAGTNQLVLSGGNVGIGTTVPSEKLTVKLGVDTDSLRINRYSAAVRAQISLGDETPTQQWRFGMTSGGGTNFTFYDGSANK
jgi:hypothetical protein